MTRNIIAILRGVQPDEAVDMAAVLLGSGITKIEVPLNSPNPFESIERIVHAFGDQALMGQEPFWRWRRFIGFTALAENLWSRQTLILR